MTAVNIGTKDDLAEELNRLAAQANAIEHFMRGADATLSAIDFGGLLDCLPADEEAKDGHSAATTLLSRLKDDLTALQALPGTDLSIALQVTASRVSQGVYAHKHVSELGM